MPIGSPPRVREKPLSNLQFFLGLGITPASAGKTHYTKSFRFWLQDHPRECGKNSFLKRQIITILGSPPRVREKPKSPFKNDYANGITPASAGKTQRTAIGTKLWRDHPRVCGKN